MEIVSFSLNFFFGSLFSFKQEIVNFFFIIFGLKSPSHRGVMFIFMRVIQTNKVYPINDNKSNEWLSICQRTEIINIIVIIVIQNM